MAARGLARLVGLEWKARVQPPEARARLRTYSPRLTRRSLLLQFGVTAATDEVDAVGSSFVQLNLKLQSSDRCGTPRTLAIACCVLTACAQLAGAVAVRAFAAAVLQPIEVAGAGEHPARARG